MPPPLLLAARLLARAAQHAERLAADLQAAAGALRTAGEHAQRAAEEGHLELLGAAVRVRLLDARVATERLPELSQEAERLSTKLPGAAMQEGGAP
jgi:hypothetical protein